MSNSSHFYFYLKKFKSIFFIHTEKSYSKLHIIKTSSVTFVLNSTKLTFKKRQITIILESLSFLEIMKKISRPLLCDWCAQKRISLRASIFFVRVYFVRLCQKIYSQFYFLSRKNWNNYGLSEKNFKTFVENYIKEKICHEIFNRKKTMLQTQFHRLILLSIYSSQKYLNHKLLFWNARNE